MQTTRNPFVRLSVRPSVRPSLVRSPVRSPVRPPARSSVRPDISRTEERAGGQIDRRTDLELIAGPDCVDVCCMPSICQGFAQKGQLLDEVELLEITIKRTVFIPDTGITRDRPLAFIVLRTTGNLPPVRPSVRAAATQAEFLLSFNSV